MSRVSLSLLVGGLLAAGCNVGTIDGELRQENNPSGDIGDPTSVEAPDAAPPPPSPDAAVPTTPTAPMSTFDVNGVSRENTLAIARASVGYTYWWGHGGLGGSKTGSCSGSCPNCTHVGSQGADCSGFVGKAWMLPESLPITGNDRHPFSTYNFRYESQHWSTIPRDDAQPGDAFVHNDDGAGHIFLYEKDDPWGSMWAFEARGCSYGIVHNIRTANSTFIAIRRDGL